jgi:hypothetical protein
VRAGPKVAVDSSPLAFRSRLSGAGRFAGFCRQYVVVPKGKGSLKPLRLRPWQVELAGSVLDPAPPPSLAGWMLPRGQGKSALVAALGLDDLMLGAEGASVVVVATDERQAGIVFGAAARMVELQPELATRVQAYQDRLVVPARGASFQVLPAVPKRLEGLNPTLAILDEFGVISRDVYEVVSPASGKRDASLTWGSAPRPRTGPTPCSRTCAAGPPSIPRTRRSSGASTRRPGSRTTRSTAGTAGSWRTQRLGTSCPSGSSARSCRRRPGRRPFAGPGCASSPRSWPTPGCHREPGTAVPIRGRFRTAPR